MKLDLKILEKIAKENNIEVRFDKLENEGGYCRYKDKKFIIINKNLPEEQRKKMLFDELSKLISNLANQLEE